VSSGGKEGGIQQQLSRQRGSAATAFTARILHLIPTPIPTRHHRSSYIIIFIVRHRTPTKIVPLEPLQEHPRRHRQERGRAGEVHAGCAGSAATAASAPLYTSIILPPFSKCMQPQATPLLHPQLSTPTPNPNPKGYKHYGFNRGECDGQKGIWYREWAPGAKALALIGEFNSWEPKEGNWAVKNEFGVWELFLPDGPDGKSAIPHKWVWDLVGGERVGWVGC